MEVFLETERLVLRRFTAANVDNLVELDSDPEVMHYITGGGVTYREEIQKEVYRPSSIITTGLRVTASGRRLKKRTRVFLGWFHLRPVPDGGRPDEPELGYRLRGRPGARGMPRKAPGR